MNNEIEEYTALEAIRLLSGIFRDNKDSMQSILYTINLVARCELGIADKDDGNEFFATIGFKIKWSDNE